MAPIRGYTFHFDGGVVPPQVVAGICTRVRLITFLRQHRQPYHTYINPTTIDLNMSTALSKLDRFKMETTFGDGFVVNATFEWKYSTMHKRLSTWRRQWLLGSGGFEHVWLEKGEEEGQLRAIKILERQIAPDPAHAHELLPLIRLAEVSNDCFCQSPPHSGIVR